jgi:putative phosphoribosyl transferase
MLFKDRHDAGKQLAARLFEYKNRKDVIVLGLARGGVIVAYEVSQALNAPLNVIVVRKVGAPGNEELAIGAVTETGDGVFNDHLISLLGVTEEYLKREVEKEKKLAAKRLALYRSNCPSPELKEKTVILVDDGIATGASMRVAIRAVKNSGAQKLILAVPVASPDSLRRFESEADKIVCLSSPTFFEAVGAFYKVFDQTTDEEIVHLLASVK